MTGPLGLVPPPPARRYAVSLRDIRAGKVDPLSEALNAAADREPELRRLMDSRASGIVFSPSLGRFVVFSVGTGTKVHITTAATREAAERLLAAGPGGRP